MLFLFVALMYMWMWRQVTPLQRLICIVIAVLGFIVNALLPLVPGVLSLTWFPQYMAAIGIPLFICFGDRLLVRWLDARIVRRKGKVDQPPAGVIEAEFTETQ